MAFGEETLKRALKAKLAETLDLHSTFQWEHFLEFGLDAHFVARFAELDGVQRLGRASDFWSLLDYRSPYEGALTLPRDKRVISIYTRRAFVYPQLMVDTRLPSLSLVGNESFIEFWFGLENGAAAFNGIASFNLRTTAAYSNRLFAVIGTAPWDVNLTYLNIDIAKPPDFSTARHIYRIIMAGNLVLFFVDTRLRAVAVQCLQGGAVKVKENVLPYGIALIPPLPSSLTALTELFAHGRSLPATSDVVAPLSPFRFRVSDGKEIVPLSLPLYLDDTDTVLAGYSIPSGSVTSHPIPTFGYTRKTIYFMASQGGTVEVQVFTLTGNWRTYDTVSTPANTLLSYTLDDEAILSRAVFTPSAYPARVDEAGVVLS